MGNNLFIAHTPHHLTLNISIIKNESLQKNILVLYDTFGISNEQIKIINKYFEKIILIENVCKDKFKNRYSIKEWIKKIKECQYDLIAFNEVIYSLKGKKIDRIFFSNNTYIEVQILLKKLKGFSTKIYYVEDGSAAYHSIVYKEKNFLVKKIMKPRYLIFGCKYKFLKEFKQYSAIGIGDYVDGGYYIYKEFIRSELKNRDSYVINKNCYKEVLEEMYVNDYKFDNSIIIILELSENLNNAEIDELTEFIKTLKYDIYLKYHPREKEFYIDFLLGDNVIKLDSRVNIESILVNTKNNLVIGNGGSTTFMTIPLISDNLCIILNKVFNLNYNLDFINIVKDLGAIEINSFTEINDLIKKRGDNNYAKQ